MALYPEIEANKHVVRQFNVEVIQGANWSRFADFVHPDFVNHTAPDQVGGDANGFRAFFETVLHKGLSGISVTILDQIAEHDKVVTRKIIEGMHTGVFLGEPPTNKRIAINVTDIVRLKEGKYVEHWGSADLLGAMRQIGAA